MHIIGNGLVILGLILIFIGLMGLYRFKQFYQRLLIASIIDTAGFISVAVGIIINSGFSSFSFKILLILLLMLSLNPIASHIIAKGAYGSGYKIEEEDTKP